MTCPNYQMSYLLDVLAIKMSFYEMTFYAKHHGYVVVYPFQNRELQFHLIKQRWNLMNLSRVLNLPKPSLN